MDIEVEDGRSEDENAARRGPRSLRRLVLSTSVLSKSDGSALVELGQTKVLCSVRGPRAAAASSLGGGGGGFQEGGALRCEVRYAPGSGVRAETAASSACGPVESSFPGSGFGGGGGSSSAAAQAEESELSRRLYDAIAPAVRVEHLAKSVVDLYCFVLQADGAVLPACVAAASLALADAAVEMDDIVACCSMAALEVAYGDGATRENGGQEEGQALLTLLADPTEEEIIESTGTVTIAMIPNFREVTLWEQTGKLSPSDSSAAIEMCRDGCATMHQFMRRCLVKADIEK